MHLSSLPELRPNRKAKKLILPNDPGRRSFFRVAAGSVLAAPAIIMSACDAEAANIQKLIAGGVSAYTSCGFTASDFNSLASGSCVVASSTVTNASNLDLFGEISFSVVNGATTTLSSAAFLFFILPENQDGSTYGDGTATGTTPPSGSYLVRSCSLKVGAGSGATLTGTCPPFPLPRGVFKFAVASGNTGALNATASATFSYRTINYNLNG